MYSFSLLQDFQDFQDCDSSNSTIILYNYPSQYLSNIERLKEKLPNIHRKLLEAYEKQYNISLKDDLPDDLLNQLSEQEKEYLQIWYPYHRKQANFENFLIDFFLKLKTHIFR